MEVRQYRQLFKNLLNDVANSVIVVAISHCLGVEHIL